VLSERVPLALPVPFPKLFGRGILPSNRESSANPNPVVMEVVKMPHRLPMHHCFPPKQNLLPHQAAPPNTGKANATHRCLPANPHKPLVRCFSEISLTKTAFMIKIEEKSWISSHAAIPSIDDFPNLLLGSHNIGVFRGIRDFHASSRVPRSFMS
jgi:hypothetical protein